MIKEYHEKLDNLGYKLDSVYFITTQNTKIWRASALFDSSRNMIREGASLYQTGIGNSEKECIENLCRKLEEPA